MEALLDDAAGARAATGTDGEGAPPEDPSLAAPQPGAADSSGGSGSRLLDSALKALVRWNDAHIDRVDGLRARFAVDQEPWFQELERAHPAIRAEWDAFAASGGQLPTMETLFEGYQGHIGGWWKAGPLIVAGRPVPSLSDTFPRTTAALLAVPGMRYATWSLMGPQAGLPEHVGTNSGALRLLVAVDGGSTSHLWVEGEAVPLPDGSGVLFDDTFSHRSWNPGPRPRAFLFADIERPLPRPHSWINHVVQRVHHNAIPRFRRAPRRATELFDVLNGGPR